MKSTRLQISKKASGGTDDHSGVFAGAASSNKSPRGRVVLIHVLIATASLVLINGSVIASAMPNPAQSLADLPGNHNIKILTETLLPYDIKKHVAYGPDKIIPVTGVVSAEREPVSNQKADQHTDKAKPSGGKWTESNSFHISLLILILILAAWVAWGIASEQLYLKNNPYHKEMRRKIREQNDWLRMMKNKKDKTEQEEASYKLMKYLKYR